MKSTGSNLKTVKRDNGSAILGWVRRKPISRVDISKLTGLSKSAVTVITKKLIDEGEIKEIGVEAINYGRHPILLDLVENYRYAIAVSITRSKVDVCIANLKLECVEQKSRDISEFSTPEAALDWVYEAGMELLKKNNIPKEKCLGIGIETPGPVDRKNGKILNPPNFPLFQNFLVKDYLKKISGMPVIYNKSASNLLLYEHVKRDPEIKNCLLVIIEDGVGSSFLQNNSIKLGAAGYMGEFGHMTVDINGPVCECGNRGCLEKYITEKAIIERYGVESYKALVDSAYSGDKRALEIMDEIAAVFAAGITSVVNLLDLDLVIIYGELNYRHEMLFGKIAEIVNRTAIANVAHKVRIEPSSVEFGGTCEFVAANIMDKHFNNWLK